jgi:hypothetical protein
MLANVNRDPKKTKPLKPSDFDPWAERVSEPAAKAAQPAVKVSTSVLARILLETPQEE